MTADGDPFISMDNGPHIFLGLSYKPFERMSFTLSPGLSYFNSRAHIALKPCFEIHPDKNRKYLARVSFTNIYIHDQASWKSEGFFSLGLGIKLL